MATDGLAFDLAEKAHGLRLESVDFTNARPDYVGAFAQMVPSELAALGVIRDGEDVSCLAVPGVGEH